jgi:hypothetical protein
MTSDTTKKVLPEVLTQADMKLDAHLMLKLLILADTLVNRGQNPMFTHKKISGSRTE